MELAELKSKEKSLESDHKKSLNKLHIEYAKSNQLYFAGQAIDNGISRILIDSVEFSGWSFNSPPCCVYYGVEHTRKNQPYKSGRRVGIRQDSNKIEVVG